MGTPQFEGSVIDNSVRQLCLARQVAAYKGRWVDEDDFFAEDLWTRALRELDNLLTNYQC